MMTGVAMASGLEMSTSKLMLGLGSESSSKSSDSFLSIAFFTSFMVSFWSYF